jgi:nucleoside-diphosphate-sugar epimerase
MSAERLVAVVGADGFVGGGFARGLGARRVVYGACRDGDVHIGQAEPLLRRADVVVNAGGFRVRRGLTYADYQRCHEVANSVFLPWIREGALFIQMSSAHVLGKSRTGRLGNSATPNPGTYPSAAYALAKLEADRAIEKAAREQGFRAVFLRPTILYDRPGDTSLPDNLCKSARAGRILRLYPRGARHHLCHLEILVEVGRRVIERDGLPDPSCLVVADPYTVTSRQLEEMIVRHLRRPARTLPIPSTLMSALLRRTFHSTNPRYDLRTWGDIFGVFHLDTEYDPAETFRLLGMDPSRYSIDRTLEPFIRQAMSA